MSRSTLLRALALLALGVIAAATRPPAASALTFCVACGDNSFCESTSAYCTFRCNGLPATACLGPTSGCYFSAAYLCGSSPF